MQQESKASPFARSHQDRNANNYNKKQKIATNATKIENCIPYFEYQCLLHILSASLMFLSLLQPLHSEEECHHSNQKDITQEDFF